MKTCNHIGLSVLLLLVVSSVSSIAKGEAIDDFNGSTTGAITGQSGGTGWNGSWTNTSAYSNVLEGNLTSSKYNVTQTGSTLQYVRVGYDEVNDKGPGGTDAGTNVYRNFADPLTSGTRWFSYLVQPGDGYSRVGLGLNETGTYASTNRILMIGQVAGDARTNDRLLVQLSGVAAYNNTNVGSYGAAYLVLGEVTVNYSGTNDRLRLWFDPDLTAVTSSSQLSTAAVDSSASNFLGDSWSSVSVTGYTSYGYLDNLRFGTFSEVAVATPEPGTIVLLGSGLIGLLAYAWRKRK
jgi:hypothetical protein